MFAKGSWICMGTNIVTQLEEIWRKKTRICKVGGALSLGCNDFQKLSNFCGHSCIFLSNRYKRMRVFFVLFRVNRPFWPEWIFIHIGLDFSTFGHHFLFFNILSLIFFICLNLKQNGLLRLLMKIPEWPQKFEIFVKIIAL